MSTPKEPAYRKRVGYQAALLGGFATMAAALLVAGNIATKDVIAERQREDLLESLNQVIPSGRFDNDLVAHPLVIKDDQGRDVTIYRGTKGKTVKALAWEIVGPGYAGDIKLLMGLDEQGQITGVRVLSHAETPGLGDKIEVARDDWILGFDGLSLGNPPAEKWGVKKDGGQFDAFTGATITPRGVVKAIKGGLTFFSKHRTELLDPPSITTTPEGK
jgi:electron transport complex protein RnfG